MNNKNTSNVLYRNIYPKFRYFMGFGRNAYGLWVNMQTKFGKRLTKSSVIPDVYSVCNTSTIDSDFNLDCFEGEMPTDIAGSLFLCQCLGEPEAFMVGDTNIIRLDFNETHTPNKSFNVDTSSHSQTKIKENETPF